MPFFYRGSRRASLCPTRRFPARGAPAGAISGETSSELDAFPLGGGGEKGRVSGACSAEKVDSCVNHRVALYLPVRGEYTRR